MTDKERAIAVFKSKIEWEKEKRYPFISNEEVEACKLAIKALEQEPMDVYYSGDGYANGYMVYDMAECQKCGYEFEDGCETWRANYCPHCGQKLNWEGLDDE